MTSPFGSMVTLFLQACFFDSDNSIGERAARLEAKWPGILYTTAKLTSNSDSAPEGRPFVDYVPLATWPLSHTQVSSCYVIEI